MFRVIGFMTGAALVISAMVVVLGEPALQEQEALSSPADAAETPSDALASVAANYAGAQPDVDVSPLGTNAELIDSKALPNGNAEPLAETTAPAEPSAIEATLSSEQELFSTPDEWLDYELPDSASDTPVTSAAVLNNVAPEGLASSDETISEFAEPTTPTDDPLWQSFWNPFRSQIAANGFAARLSAITDIDYRVLRLKPDAYQVAFAYADDNERVAKLAQIETATGLSLPEARP